MTGTSETIFQSIVLNSVFNNDTVVLNLGIVSLNEADRLMHILTQWRSEEGIADSLFLLSHPPSLAVGARELNQADLLMPLSFFENQGIYLYKNIRGGGLTYHWDGQLVCYPVLKLKHHEQNISNYMYKLEEVALRTLKDLGIVAERKREKAAQIGLWLGNNKIASMGIHVSKWITSWGFALNLYGDKSPADFIRPCGLEGVNLITVEDVMGFKPLKRSVMERVIYHFGEVFNRKVEFPKNKTQITNKFQIQMINDPNTFNRFSLKI
jgi:lipoate-protein ligase B